MKKKLPLYILVVFALFILQTTIFNYIKILDMKPNLLLIFVCIMSYLRGNKEGMILGISVGLFVDIMSGRVIGMYGIVFMLAGFILGSIPRKFFWDNIIITLIFTFVIMIPSEVLLYWLYKVINYVSGGTEYMGFSIWETLAKLVLPGTLYNLIVFPGVYWMCSRIDKFFDKDIRSFAF